MYENMKPPAYLEAYPRLNIVQAKAALERELVACEFTNERRMTFGLARMGEGSATHFTLDYSIHVPFLKGSISSISLELVETPNGVDPNRTVVLCPQCCKNKIVLIFCNSWKCARCHGLVYRNQCIGHNTILFEKINALKAQLANGRPKGMHVRTYSKLRHDYNDLSKRLKGSNVHEANGDCSFILTSIWRGEMEGDFTYFLATEQR